MMELEQAYRLLELKPGAGIKEAVEAREDQLALWDPERLAHHPRLRSRAADRIEAIRQAYEVVMGHLGESGNRPAESRGGTHARVGAAGSAAAPAAASRRAGAGSSSLFDEVFSTRLRTRRFPRPAVVLAVLTLLALALAFFWFGGDDAISPSEPPPPSETGGIVSDPDGGNPSLADAPSEPAQFPMPARRAPERAADFSPPPARLPPPRPDAPKLVRRTGGAAEPGGESAKPSAEPPLREGEWIFRRLLSASPTARRLAEGGFRAWRFQGWEIVQAEPPDYWIDLSALPEAGPMAHFVWSVNLRDGSVAAWSESARELEASP